MHSETITLYDADFYGWTQQQSELLRSRQLDQLDINNLVEEIESLGRQERRELENRLAVLVGHLLKWHYQPKQRSRSWFATIDDQRERIARLIKQNPSLKPYLPEAMAIAYRDGVKLFGQETGLDYRQLPQSCPFSVEQVFEEALDFPQS